jgi:HEAT repeat protein
VTYFCSQCWKEIERETKTCPFCGAEQNLLDEESYVKKLIRSLHHPEPETPVRAAFILGKLHPEEAKMPLMETAEQGKDPHIRAAAIDALGEYDTTDVLMFLKRVKRNPKSIIERSAAEKMILKLEGRTV